jgi:hypothetical protein
VADKAAALPGFQLFGANGGHMRWVARERIRLYREAYPLPISRLTDAEADFVFLIIARLKQ